jgi:hypothetical protein
MPPAHKPTINPVKSRQNRYDAVIDIRREAIEASIHAKLRSKRTPAALQGRPPENDYLPMGSDALRTLFQTWKDHSTDIGPLTIIMTEFRSRSNPPIDDMAAFFVASDLHWLVRSLEGAPVDYIELVTELLSFLSKVETPEFAQAVMSSGLSSFLQALINSAPPPPPATVKNILWFWANLPGEGLVERDYLLKIGVLHVIADYLTMNAGVDECLETSAWLLERLTSGLPLPDFMAIQPILPVIQPMLDYSVMNQSPDMQIDLIKVLHNLIRYDTVILHEVLTQRLLTTLMNCAHNTRSKPLAALCMTFFTQLTSSSDKYCEILLEMNFLDFLESRIRIDFPQYLEKGAEYVSILKCFTNILFATHNLQRVVLSRPYLCETLKCMLECGMYNIVVESLFLIANSFYACTTFEEVLAVADLDEAKDFIYWITGRDRELSDMLIISLDKVVQLLLTAAGNRDAMHDRLLEFSNAWFLSKAMEDVLGAYIDPENEISPTSFASATGLIDKIQGLKFIFEMTEEAALQSMRSLIHNGNYEF